MGETDSLAAYSSFLKRFVCITDPEKHRVLEKILSVESAQQEALRSPMV
jgi:hypothetical protein